MPALQQPQERRLRHALGAAVDGGVGQRPVHRQPEVPPQMLERLLVLGRQPVAQLDEVRTRDRDRLLARLVRRLKVRVVRQRRIAADAVVVLHAALGGQAVVVPPHRIEHRLAAHPLEARDDVGVGVGEDVADVQRAADRRRRRVDRDRPRVARARAIEAVGALASQRAFHFASRPSSAGFLGGRWADWNRERRTFGLVYWRTQPFDVRFADFVREPVERLRSRASSNPARGVGCVVARRGSARISSPNQRLSDLATTTVCRPASASGTRRARRDSALHASDRRR